MKRRNIRVAVGIALLGAVSVGGAAFAQDKSIEQRLEELDQEVKILKRQQELDKETTAAKPKPPVLQADDKGFGFKSADGNFAVRVGGQAKADGLFYLEDDTKRFNDTFTISSARLVLQGTVYKQFDFTVSGEFGGSSPALWDSFVEWKHWPALKVRAGRYKQPFSVERLQADTATAFTSLGLPSQLTPNRDVALQLSGDILDGVLGYAVSIGNGVADAASGNGDNGDDKELTGRLWVSPFKTTDIEPLQGLSLGLAASYGIQDGQTNAANLGSYRTAGGNTFFSYQSGGTNASFATGDRVRLSPQFAYYYGRLGLIGEYVISSQEIQRPAPGRQDTLRHDAWQVVGSFALTDDKPSYRGITPKKPFSLKDGTWGAFEVVGRFGVLDIDNDTFLGDGATRFANPSTQASKATSWGVGLNWYLNRNVRLFLDYDQTKFDGGAGTVAAVTDRQIEHFLSTRFQVVF